jgi:putative membrane protein
VNFELGGVHVQGGFPMDVTLLAVGLLAGYWGLIRRHGTLMAPNAGSQPVTTKQVVFFSSGVALFWLMDGWPIQPLTEHLISAHMLQHLVQAYLIPPLLLLGIPGWMGDVLLRGPRVRAVVRRLGHPVVAFMLFNAWLLATHTPQLIDLQSRSDLFHALDHLLLIGTGLLVWANLWSPVPSVIKPLPELGQMFYLFLLTLLPTIPSAFLVFGETLLYPVYADALRPWGIPVLDDMQWAGLIMKLGGGFYLWGIITVKYFRWTADQERKERAERANRLRVPAGHS